MTSEAPSEPAWLADLVVQGIEAIAAFDATGTLIYANRKAAALLGHRPESMVGLDIGDLLHNSDVGRAAANIEGLTGGARPRPGLMRLRCADGSWTRLEINPMHLTLPGNPPEAIIAVTLRDTSLDDAHWSFLASLAGGDSFHTSIKVLATGLSNEIDGPLSISYDNFNGVRRTAGPVPFLLSGVTLEGTFDFTPGTPWANAAQTGAPVWCATEDLPEPYRTEARACGYEAGVAVPVDDVGRDLPALLIQWPPVGAMGSILTESLRRRPHEALRVALDRREVNRRLERMALSDGLTGLANRARFFDVLQAHATSRRPYGVCYIDLDRFKPINDTYGHRVGDEVLVICARRFEHLARSGDVVARLGGDEFAVACSDIGGDELEAIAARLVAGFAEPVLADGRLVEVGTSVGCALATPGTDPDAVVAAADTALYEAKGAGRNTWRRAPLDAPM